MRPVRALLIYIATVFLVGAMMAPWLYKLMQWAAPQVSALQGLARAPFHRYLSRSLLAVAFLGLWPFLRSLGATSWQAVGFVKAPNQWHRLIHGLILGLLTIVAAAVVALTAGSRQWESQDGITMGLKLVGIAGSAIVVAVIEELLFRGTLFGALRREHDWRVALWISSSFYAAVHFFQRVKAPSEVHWASGLDQLARMTAGFIDPHLLVPGFLALTLAGLALGIAYHRTGDLSFSIGMHAGWVFGLKTLNLLTHSRPHANELLQMSKNLYDGWLGLLGSVVAVVAVCSLMKSRAPSQQDGLKRVMGG
jgi:membrane protease YdiL (CAAX protease family)